MKKSLYLSLFAVMACALTACSATPPNEATLALTDLEDVNIHTDFQQGLIDSENPDFYISQHEYEFTTFSNSAPKATTFNWDVVTDNGATANKYTVSLSETGDFTDSIEYVSKTNSIDIYNLKIATNYSWKVTAHYSKGVTFESPVSTFTTLSDGPRNIYAEGVENMRDLGGYYIGENKIYRQGLIYRSAQFNYDRKNESAIPSAPTSKGKDTLINELGIKTDIDIRQKSTSSGKDETLGISSSPIGKNVDYIYLPMEFGQSNVLTNENNKDSLLQFFELCALESTYPMVFHCVRGTDRTGAIAYAIGALCGVSEDLLLKDYLFSNFAYITGSPMTSRDIDGTSFFVRGIRNSSGNTISEKARNYLHNEIGVSYETLDKIVDILVETK